MFLFQYCMRLPAMILYIAYLMHVPTGHDSIIIVFCIYFFDNHPTKNCPIFKNLPLHKNTRTTFFALLTFGPLLHLKKLPHFSSNLPLHKNDSFLLSSKCAPMLQLQNCPNFWRIYPCTKNTKMTTFLPLPNLPHFLYLQNNASTNCVTNQKTDWLTKQSYLQKDEQTDKNLYYLDLQDRLTDEKYIFSFLT